MADKLVIYVEDNPANFTLVKRLLQATGRYEVVQAWTGEEGLEMVRARKPDVLLLDLDLPGISGIEVATQLRAEAGFKELPILVVTASVMKRERTAAENAGCDGFIEKPFDIGHLRRMVDLMAGFGSQ